METAVPGALSAVERARGQRYALLTNLFGSVTLFIVTGPMMMLYANDVLHMQPKQIASIMAFSPFVALFALPLLGRIRKSGKVRSLRRSATIQLLVTLVLVAVPSRALSYPLYLALLITYAIAMQLGSLAMWQPLMRGITTNDDRGAFFGRMRFAFTVVTTVATAAIAMFVGEQITEWQYKLLLTVAVLGLSNNLFWSRGIPEIREIDNPDVNDASDAAAAATLTPQPAPPHTFATTIERLTSPTRSFLRRAQRAPVLRLPLLVTLLMALGVMPVHVLYLSRMLLVPSNIVGIYVFAITLGSAISLLFWGRIADAIGFRPMLGGLLALALCLTPLHLVMLPLSPGATWGTLSGREGLTVGLLIAVGLGSGAIQAGIGIATVAIQHFHVRHEQSVEAMTLFGLAVQVTAAAAAFFGGVLLEDLALPHGLHFMFHGQLEIDWFKAYMVGVVPILYLICLGLLPRLPNARPYFGVTDFFNSLVSDPVRTLAATRHVYHEDEDRRIELARWLGNRFNPIGIASLFELLEDPSYDVKVEAIRSLGRSRSPAAADRLLALLDNDAKAHLGEHLAWALGELRHAPAYDALVTRLSPEWPPRVRAMAARALGKVGDARALEPLAAMLRERPERPDRHVVSSACRALLRLNGVAHSEGVFETVFLLEHRDERYELLNVLCEWIRIPNRWLLQSNAEQRSQEALLDDADRRSEPWRRARAPVLDALRNRDAAAVGVQFATATLDVVDRDDVVILGALGSAMHRHPEWNHLHILAVAWLLYRR